MPPSRLSIVMPALNEAGAITATLEALAPLRRQGHEAAAATPPPRWPLPMPTACSAARAAAPTR